MLYSPVPRSSAWPSSVTLAAPSFLMQSARSDSACLASSLRLALLNSKRMGSKVQLATAARWQVPPTHSCPWGQSSLRRQLPAAATHCPSRHFWPWAHSLSLLQPPFGTHRLPSHLNPGLQFWSPEHSTHCPCTQTSLW